MANPNPQVFAQTFESLFKRALEGRIDPATKGKLKEIGVDLDKPLLPVYPFATWMQSVALCAAAVHPGKRPEEARYLLGRAVITGYGQTVLGRALLRFLKLMGPTLAIRNATNSFKTGNNFTETRLEELGPGKVNLWMNDVGGYPEFTAGILAAGVEAAGGKDVKVDHQHRAPSATYKISWSA